jgi:hypothetical protein
MRPSTAKSFLAADGATSLLLWVVMTGAVVLVALTATWFLGSMAIDGLLNMATRCAQQPGVFCCLFERLSNREDGYSSKPVAVVRVGRCSRLPPTHDQLWELVRVPSTQTTNALCFAAGASLLSVGTLVCVPVGTLLMRRRQPTVLSRPPRG